MVEMNLEEKVKYVMEKYEFDITHFVPIPCKKAYICMGETRENDNIEIYTNMVLSKKEFEKYLYEQIPKIEYGLKHGELNLDTQLVAIEFENDKCMTISSSEWLGINFD